VKLVEVSVVLTFSKHSDLAKASLETCLLRQPARLLNDTDEREMNRGGKFALM
jgi:hypothetical protein